MRSIVRSSAPRAPGGVESWKRLTGVLPVRRVRHNLVPVDAQAKLFASSKHHSGPPAFAHARGTEILAAFMVRGGHTAMTIIHEPAAARTRRGVMNDPGLVTLARGCRSAAANP